MAQYGLLTILTAPLDAGDMPAAERTSPTSESHRVFGQGLAQRRGQLGAFQAAHTVDRPRGAEWSDEGMARAGRHGDVRPPRQGEDAERVLGGVLERRIAPIAD